MPPNWKFIPPNKTPMYPTLTWKFKDIGLQYRLHAKKLKLKLKKASIFWLARGASPLANYLAGSATVHSITMLYWVFAKFCRNINLRFTNFCVADLMLYLAKQKHYFSIYPDEFLDSCLGNIIALKLMNLLLKKLICGNAVVWTLLSDTL